MHKVCACWPRRKQTLAERLLRRPANPMGRAKSTRKFGRARHDCASQVTQNLKVILFEILAVFGLQANCLHFDTQPDGLA